MSKVENVIRLARSLDRLCSHEGAHKMSPSEIATLLRCSARLSRVAEAECNGEYEEGDAGWVRVSRASRCGTVVSRVGCRDPYKAPLARAWDVILRGDARTSGLGLYHQTDPRGCALYVYLLSDPRAAKIEECYASIGVPLAV